MSALMNELNKIDSFFSKLNENKFNDLILYGSDKFDDRRNHNILMCTTKINQKFSKIWLKPAIKKQDKKVGSGISVNKQLQSFS